MQSSFDDTEDTHKYIENVVFVWCMGKTMNKCVLRSLLSLLTMHKT